MSKEKKRIPELRFPEFVNDGDWEIKKLGEIGDPLMCKRVFKEQTTTNSENGIPFYKIGTFGRKADAYISIELYNDFKEKFSFPKKGDILISASGTIGRLVVYDGEPAYFQDSNIVWLGNDEELIINKLLFYCYSTVNWQTSDGGIIKRLYNSDFRNIEIKYPKRKAEQQKIAECLSSLDNLIEAHNQKLEALKDHKKGLMQNLFPQDGEKVPKLRFPEFENDGEWVNSKLGEEEVCSFVNSKIDSEQLTLSTYISTDNMLPEYSGVTKASKLPTTNRVTEFLIGDVLVSNIRPYLKKVWKADRNGGASNDVLVFRSGSRITSDFLEYMLKNDAFINYVMKSAKGVKMPRGDKDSMMKYSINIPEPAEQLKISVCLSSLDKLINKQTDKVEQLKEHKKGLMQGLFVNVK